MNDSKGPRFFDLQEHKDGSEVVWKEAPPPSKGFRFLRRGVLYTILLLIAGGAGYYIYLHLMGQKQLITPVNTSPLAGALKRSKVTLPPKPVTPPKEEFIERKIRKMITKDKEIRVKRGDTFLGLLNYFYHGYDRALQKKVKAANPQIKNFSSLRVGQYLLMPDVEEEVEITERILVESQGSNEMAQKKRVKITEHQGGRNEHWLYVNGRIQNETAQEHDFIKVNVDFYDEAGAMISSDFTYAVGETAFKPGEGKKFLIMSRNSPQINRYELYLEYY